MNRYPLFRHARHAALILALSVGAACQPTAPPEQAAEERTTLILVRHAEKADDGTEDPPLTEQGRLRAETLADWLSFTDLAAIYSTPYLRNQATVAPTARRQKLTPETYDAGGDVAAFLQGVMERHAGKQVLVCGHSNTIPSMLNVLVGEERYENLADDAYDHVYIATLRQPGDASVVDLRMEAATGSSVQ